MANQIVTKKFHVDNAESFVESIEQGESAYYMFAARSAPFVQSDQVPDPIDSVDAATFNIYEDMVFGKRVNVTDVSFMVPRHDWAVDTVFDMYDDLDANLYSKAFYATVNTGAQAHVYKCLYNNNGAKSTVEPSGTDINPFETPADGYIWKYMYTANDFVMSKFSTNDFVPIVANTIVQANAVSGAINVIRVEDGGLKYNNYIVGSFATSADIRVSGNPLYYSLGGDASTTNDFYNNCLIKMTSGAAKDEYRLVTDYFVQGGQKIIVLDEPFTSTVVATDSYEIYPYVFVYDKGGQMTANCVARAIVSDVAGNSIQTIEILEPGAGYRSASAILLPNPVVGVTSNASLRPVISPPGGHGYDVHNELGANYICVGVRFIGNETPLTTANDYRTIGIVKDPLFANVSVKIESANTIGAFAIGENVYQYTPVQLAGTVETFSNSTIVGSNTFFSTNLVPGDGILISDGTTNVYGNVSSISSNTSLTLTTNASFSNTGCTISLVRNASAVGVLIANSAGEIFVSNLSSAGLTTSPLLLGQESYATTNVDESLPSDERVTINGRDFAGYQKYTQLVKLVGTLVGTPFIEDEFVYQSTADLNSQPIARVHSLVDNGGNNSIMYLTNVTGIFQTQGSPDSDGIVVGNTSGAQFTVDAKFNGDIVPDSGEVLFIENLNTITRANNQTETIKLILQF